jgi:hypothetical protein
VSAQLEPTQKSFFVRFPNLPERSAGLLAKALDYERCAGNYVRSSEPGKAEHMRAQARAAWVKYQEASR